MGHFTTTTRQILCASFGISGIATSVFALGAVLALSDSAHAAKKPAAPPPPASEADQKKIAAAAARRAYDSGVQDYASGKHQAAVDQLSTALRGGGLTSAEMAKALYLRGVSYKKLNRPGLAISDLTSALWLKNGLGEADQKIAMAERAEAYRMAGLGDGNSGADKVAVADPNPSPAGSKAVAPPAAAPAIAAVPAPIPAPVPAPAAASAATPAPMTSTATADVSSGQVTRQSPDSEAARDAANARRLAAQPVETNGLQAVATATVVGDAFTGPPAASPVVLAPAPASLQSTLASPGTPTAAPVLSAAPIEEQVQPAAPVTSSGGGIGSFFSNLFSGGSSSSQPAPVSPASVTTASTSPPPAATSSWSDTTSVASGNAKSAAAKPVQVATAPHPPIPVAAPAAPAVKAGKYKLHIAAVRSREEADALAQKLASQQGAALKSRIPVVDEAVIGSMGKFYRVRVGSYANADEPRGVCNALRSSGYDCLVVTN